MRYFSYALILIAGIAGAIFLVMNDHPVFALAVLFLVGCVEFGERTKQ